MYRLDGLMLKYWRGLKTSEYYVGCVMPSPWCLVRVQWEPLPSCPDLQAPCVGICSLSPCLSAGSRFQGPLWPLKPSRITEASSHVKGPERRPSKDSRGQRGWSVCLPSPCWLRSSSHASWGRAGGPRACCKGARLHGPQDVLSPGRLRFLFLGGDPWSPVPPSARRLAGSGDGGLQSPMWLGGRGPHLGSVPTPEAGSRPRGLRPHSRCSATPQYHALGLLYHVRKNDRLAVSKMLSKFTRHGLKSPFAYCMMIRVASRQLEDEDGR